MAYLNCDNQPILCNAWSAGPASLYIIEMLPEPAPVEIYSKRLNLTTTTSDTLVAFHESGSKDQFHRIDSSWFHPFNGKLAEYGVSSSTNIDLEETAGEEGKRGRRRKGR